MSGIVFWVYCVGFVVWYGGPGGGAVSYERGTHKWARGKGVFTEQLKGVLASNLRVCVSSDLRVYVPSRLRVCLSSDLRVCFSIDLRVYVPRRRLRCWRSRPVAGFRIQGWGLGCSDYSGGRRV